MQYHITSLASLIIVTFCFEIDIFEDISKGIKGKTEGTQEVQVC